MMRIIKILLILAIVTPPSLYLIDLLDQEHAAQWWVNLVIDMPILYTIWNIHRDKDLQKRLQEGKIKDRVGRWLLSE